MSFIYLLYVVVAFRVWFRNLAINEKKTYIGDLLDDLAAMI